MSERTRSGQHRAPKCPHCGGRLRVKPAPRTRLVQAWQCAACLKTRPADECEWSNAGLMLAAFDAAESESASDSDGDSGSDSGGDGGGDS